MVGVIEDLVGCVSCRIDDVLVGAKRVNNFGGCDIVITSENDKKEYAVRHLLKTSYNKEISWLIEELKRGDKNFNDPKYYDVIFKSASEYVTDKELDRKDNVKNLLLSILKALKEVI